jgi:L-ascorbate metabolism protein UlaG (beta-lactamase superfamily)
MTIKWLGHACFLITLKNDKKILIDPYDNTVGYEPIDEQADILLISHDHYDHNYKDGVSGNYTLIDKEGDYDIDGISIKGILQPHDEAYGAKRGNVITFLINADNLNILFLSDIGMVPQKEYFDSLPDIDILLLPVGGVYTIDAKEAIKIMDEIHPNITIPMHYMTSCLKFALKGVHEFLQLAGKEYDKSRLGNSEFEITADNLKKRSRIVIMEHSN